MTSTTRIPQILYRQHRQKLVFIALSDLSRSLSLPMLMAVVNPDTGATGSPIDLD